MSWSAHEHGTNLLCSSNSSPQLHIQCGNVTKNGSHHLKPPPNKHLSRQAQWRRVVWKPKLGQRYITIQTGYRYTRLLSSCLTTWHKATDLHPQYPWHSGQTDSRPCPAQMELQAGLGNHLQVQESEFH